MKVAVLGSSGGMGYFFVRYFLEKGALVRGADIAKAKKGARTAPRGLNFCSSNVDAVRGSDVVIIASPMGTTLKVAQEVAEALKRGSTVVEMTSVKGETLSELKKIVGDRATVLSIHPLFGPALESYKGMKIAVVTKKESRERELAAKLFPEARIIPMSRKEHDKTMAVVLSLTHILNIIYAKTVSQFLSPEEFMKVSTPNSSMQLTLAEAVLAQDPNLSFSIQAGNVYSSKVVKAASRELKKVESMLEESDSAAFGEYFSALSKRYKTDERASAVIREIYSAAENAA